MPLAPHLHSLNVLLTQVLLWQPGVYKHYMTAPHLHCNFLASASWNFCCNVCGNPGAQLNFDSHTHLEVLTQWETRITKKILHFSFSWKDNSEMYSSDCPHMKNHIGWFSIFLKRNVFFSQLKNLKLRDILVMPIFTLVSRHAILAFRSILSAPKSYFPEYLNE